MLDVIELSKSYQSKTALRQLSFSAKKGEIIGLLGPNGSGKSTTLKILASLIKPSAGEVKFEGEDIFKNLAGYRQHIAYVPEVTATYTELTVLEVLRYTASLADLVDPKVAIAKVLEELDLKTVKTKVATTLSKGYQQRLMLAVAIVKKPQILILDEPNTGLDIKTLGAFKQVLRSNQTDMLTIMSSHQLLELKDLCTRIITLKSGKMSVDSPMQQFDLDQYFSGDA